MLAMMMTTGETAKTTTNPAAATQSAENEETLQSVSKMHENVRTTTSTKNNGASPMTSVTSPSKEASEETLPPDPPEETPSKDEETGVTPPEPEEEKSDKVRNQTVLAFIDPVWVLNAKCVHCMR